MEGAFFCMEFCGLGLLEAEFGLLELDFRLLDPQFGLLHAAFGLLARFTSFR